MLFGIVSYDFLVPNFPPLNILFCNLGKTLPNLKLYFIQVYIYK